MWIQPLLLCRVWGSAPARLISIEGHRSLGRDTYPDSSGIPQVDLGIDVSS